MRIRGDASSTDEWLSVEKAKQAPRRKVCICELRCVFAASSLQASRLATTCVNPHSHPVRRAASRCWGRLPGRANTGAGIGGALLEGVGRSNLIQRRWVWWGEGEIPECFDVDRTHGRFRMQRSWRAWSVALRLARVDGKGIRAKLHAPR